MGRAGEMILIGLSLEWRLRACFIFRFRSTQRRAAAGCIQLRAQPSAAQLMDDWLGPYTPRSSSLLSVEVRAAGEYRINKTGSGSAAYRRD